MTVRDFVLRFAIVPAALGAFAAVTPVSAQWGPPPPPSYGGRIHPQEIETRVRSMGYQPVAEPRTRGPLWVTHAVDRDGQHVRVLIDSFSGRVIDVLRRPMPPQNVSLNPPPNLPAPQGDARFPQQYPPQANAPRSDYEDDGPDYDYRDAPRNQRPADWPPSRPNAQPQGPTVIPLDPRSDTNRLPAAPKTNTAKNKETKEKKNDTTAAVTPEKEKQNSPSPKSRPADAPKADAQKNVQAPKMPAIDNQRGPDPQTTGAVPPPVQPLDTNRPQTPNAAPPVQPPF